MSPTCGSTSPLFPESPSSKVSPLYKLVTIRFLTTLYYYYFSSNWKSSKIITKIYGTPVTSRMTDVPPVTGEEISGTVRHKQGVSLTSGLCDSLVNANRVSTLDASVLNFSRRTEWRLGHDEKCHVDETLQTSGEGFRLLFCRGWLVFVYPSLPRPPVGRRPWHRSNTDKVLVFGSDPCRRKNKNKNTSRKDTYRNKEKLKRKTKSSLET